MTHVIFARNVNDALVSGLFYLRQAGKLEYTRAGECLVAPGPVVTEYARPQERVLFDPRRDANPVFHLMESIWMLSGSDDGEWLLPFNSGFSKFLEEDGTQHGAYGARWRGGRVTQKDQIAEVTRLLHRSPETRQAVMQMWDADIDLCETKKDIPCNTHIYFDRRGGRLNMTVCCRSNDIIWGAYGANAVHFSILQEVIASRLEIPVGVYRQFSNNYHAYVDVPVTNVLLDTPLFDDPYAAGKTSPAYTILTSLESLTYFLDQCKHFVLGSSATGNLFLDDVAAPLREAYLARHSGDMDWARFLRRMPDCDWKMAFNEWTARRAK